MQNYAVRRIVGSLFFIVVMTILPAVTAAQTLPDKCDSLPVDFEVLQRPVLEQAHNDVLAVFGMSPGRETSLRAVAMLPTMKRVYERAMQKRS
jgi:hypothetical protein